MSMPKEDIYIQYDPNCLIYMLDDQQDQEAERSLLGEDWGRQGKPDSALPAPVGNGKTGLLTATLARTAEANVRVRVRRGVVQVRRERPGVVTVVPTPAAQKRAYNPNPLHPSRKRVSTKNPQTF